MLQRNNPIHTEKAECQDCYKCVRGCPVKAIKVENGSATVLHDGCILCGSCVNVCPSGAKKVRSDLGRVKQLFKRKERVYASLAPSFISEFEEFDIRQLITAIRTLGFTGVSETALGAQEVSAHTADYIKQHPGRIHISTACPTVVTLIEKFYPHLQHMLLPHLSPLLAHTRLLRREFGDNIGIVFIGPCIAKKQESDRRPSELDISISFADLREWLLQEKINPRMMQPTPEDCFLPEIAEEGAMYPVDGGMIASMSENAKIADCASMAFSGLDQIRNALEDLDRFPKDKTLFLELLACEGGCVNGPMSCNRTASALKRFQVLDYAPDKGRIRQSAFAIDRKQENAPIPAKPVNEESIREALRSIGKYTARDELNCSGCGYESCRQFAAALLEQKAEQTMCASYMRKLAQKKANALIKSMPSGMVIVDEEMKIVECNARFAAIMGTDIEQLFEAKPGLEGASLEKIVPFHSFFRTVLEIGEDILDRDIRHNKNIFHVSIFSIEKHRYVGAIIQDITTPAVRKEQIIRKAERVIQKNLATVQQIAYLLGENASETEVMLESIIDSFSPGREQEEEQ